MLRFTKDDGTDFPDWEEKKIGDIGCFIKGAGLSKADISNVGTPLILYGELYTTYSEVAYDIKRKTQAIVDDKYYSLVGDVIIPTSGESAEEISTATCVMVPGVVLGGDLNIFRSSILDGRIMSYILNHQAKWKIAAIAQGKSIVHVQAKQLANISVTYPVSECEQQKIADSLSTIDTVIEKQKATVKAWEERKKGVMQKLFSQEVRFKADDGSEFPDWEEKPFGEIVSEFKIKTKTEDEDVLLSCAIGGVFLNSELFGHQRGKSNIGYLKIQKGTLILSAQNLHLGNANVNMRFEHGIISPAYKTYNIVGCSIEYMSQWVKWDRTKQFFYNATTVGASECRRNVDWDMLYSQNFSVPCLDEQQKIANCLSSLDDVIEKQKATLEAWKEMKKGLLQQMFV